MKTLLLIIASITCYSSFAQVSLVKDLRMASHPYEVNGSLLFAADSENSNHINLWISDGTPNGTQPLKTFGVGVFAEQGVGYNLYKPIVFKNELYFLADSDGLGMSLWKSDGTFAGTTQVKSFNSSMLGPYNDSYPFFCILGDQLLFAAGDGTHGVELWKTDGTTVGTVMVKRIANNSSTGSQPSWLTVYNNKVYFSAYDETYGVEIWQTDGTDVGTTILKDILPGTDGATDDGYGGSINAQLTVSGSYLYFIGHYGSATSAEYTYRTDGTANGTIVLDTMDERFDPLDYHYPFAYDVNGTLMYIGFLEPGGKQTLFKSNGTPQTTVPVNNGNGPEPEGSLFAFQNKLYYHGGQNQGADDGLCTSDGNTSALVVAFPQTYSSPDILDFFDDGNSFFFRGEMTVTGSTTEWRMVQSNGTTGGTLIYTGAYARGFIASYNGNIYFEGADSATSNILSLYKLTPSTALAVKDAPEIPADVNVFPNPVSNTLFIHTTLTSTDNAQLVVFNTLGEMVYTILLAGSGSTMPVDVSKWESGIYFCKLQQSENTETLKVVVQH